MTAIPSFPSTLLYVLPDGRSLQFGPITRASRPLIERAIAGLSPLTSYRRFFTVRYRLSDAELDALTDLDGVNRFAVGASIRNGSGVDGVGVARFVRDRERRTSQTSRCWWSMPSRASGSDIRCSRASRARRSRAASTRFVGWCSSITRRCCGCFAHSHRACDSLAWTTTTRSRRRSSPGP